MESPIAERYHPRTVFVPRPFGAPRGRMGIEGLLLAYCGRPRLIQTVVDDQVAFHIALYDPILPQVKPDMVITWKDISFKNGPLITP